MPGHQNHRKPPPNSCSWLRTTSAEPHSCMAVKDRHSVGLLGSVVAPQLLQHSLAEPDGIKFAVLRALDDVLRDHLGEGSKRSARLSTAQACSQASCCARAANGQAAAPPSSAISSRRLTRSPRRRWRVTLAELPDRAPWQS